MKEIKNPLVSVVINCHNCGKFLQEAIDSVYGQTYQNWEIVLWDNASTDEGCRVKEAYDGRIKYFYSNECEKLYSARNKALAECNGKLIAFLDSDDIWEESKLEKQVGACLLGDGVIYSKFQFIDQNGKNISMRDVDYRLGLSAKGLLTNNPISISSVMINTDIVKDFEFDKRYNLLGDFDLWFRLSLEYSFSFIDETLEFSRQHKNCTSIVEKDGWIREQRYFFWNKLLRGGVMRQAGLIKATLYLVKCELIRLLRR